MRRLALIALVAVACGTQGQDVRLVYHKGDTYKYAIHSTANETIDAGILTVPVKLDMTANQTITVTAVDSSGTADLSIEMSNLSIKTTMNDSTSTSGVPSQTITMRVNADGSIVSVNGNAMAGNPLAALAGVGGGFISAVLPDHPVKPGDTWSKTYDQANPQGTGSIHVKADSKYVKDDAKLAVIETTSNSTIDMTLDMTKLAAGQATVPGMPPGLIQSLTFKGTIKGVITTSIDPSTHRVAKSHRTSKVDAKMTMNFSPGAAQGSLGLTGPIGIKGDETTDLTPA